MWCQLSTGRDSFRAQESSPRRNVSVSTFTRVPDDGEGQQIIPLFAAHQKKLRGFGQSNVVSIIPATDKFAENDAGQWFINRHELLPGTEVLIEYRWKKPTGGFAENIEWLLLVVDQNAPLWQLRIDLPRHFLSNVPAVFFEGRFEIIRTDDQLDAKALAAWRKHIHADDDYNLCDYLDPNMDGEDQQFRYMELEPRIAVTSKMEIKEGEDGKTRLRIKRHRKIKIR